MLPPQLRREAGAHFVQRALRRQRQGLAFEFVVQIAGSTEVVGYIALINYAKDYRRAEVGYWIRRKHWGRGYATDALRLACSFGFGHLGLHRLAASVVDGNGRSTAVLGNLGFRLEGRRRREVRLGPRWADVLEFGLLVEEWDPESLDRGERTGKRGRPGRNPRSVLPSLRR